MTVKFDQKNVAVFGKLQTAEGVPANPTTTDALAVTDLSAEVTRDFSSYEYKGDSLSREEFTTLKDSYANVPAKTLMPTLGTLNPGLAPTAAPLYQWFTACNANVTVDTTGAVTYANDVAVNQLLTIDYFKSSPEVSVANTAKRYRFTDCRGSLDISFETGNRAELSFTFLGNAGTESMETELVPDLGTQVEDVAAVVRLQNMQHSIIKEILGTQAQLTISSIQTFADRTDITTSSAHGLSVGETITVAGTTNQDDDYIVSAVTSTTAFKAIPKSSGAVDYVLVNTSGQLVYPNGTVVTATLTTQAAENTGTATAIFGVPKQMCTNSGNFSNFFGFSYERYLMTCQEGFSKRATPTDVGLVVLEDETGGNDFDPVANIEKFFTLSIRWGTGAGKYVTVEYSKIQLTDVKDTAIGSYFGKDLSFRNTGISKLILS